MDWQVIFASISNSGHHVVDGSWPNNPERLEFVDARIAGVELRGYFVAQDVALQQSTQIFLDSLLFGVHGYRERAGEDALRCVGVD